ncbi:hypothetical protein GCM10007049_07550 [Echinicola pacifica]|uniref:Pvc16 N-terminal domain-containing protein n=1 Tax=Echinicola pacifica TaxID=346377 RepID=A0A918PNQ7_9BACT|nr:DUF4255 domain-containing protein [Echinicola pacifica]GGZ17488.1 hypothetical protein GCM10007049_07550 [Echinicola pacifica]
MIFEVLTIIAGEVNKHFDILELDESRVVLDNVALLESRQEGDDSLSNKIVLSMINLQEEVTLKNIPNQRYDGESFVTKNPVLNLNLFLIFCANRTKYKTSLSDLSKILAFFQGKKVFNQSNTVFDRDLEEMNSVQNFHFTMNLYTPTFEELNFIWGTLGGRQYPSIFYRLNVIEIDRDLVQAKKGVISTINRTYTQE